MLLRKVEKRRWDWADGEIPWLLSGEFPASPLGDLRTSVDSRLSVWQIEDNRSNLESVIAALAATRQNLDIFDYALFPEGVVGETEIQMAVTRGQSADPAANYNWHRDLVKLSAAKLVKLAQLIHRRGSVDRFSEKQVKEIIRQSVEAGRIDRERLSEQVAKSVFGT